MSNYGQSKKDKHEKGNKNRSISNFTGCNHSPPYNMNILYDNNRFSGITGFASEEASPRKALQPPKKMILNSKMRPVFSTQQNSRVGSHWNPSMTTTKNIHKNSLHIMICDNNRNTSHSSFYKNNIEEGNISKKSIQRRKVPSFIINNLNHKNNKRDININSQQSSPKFVVSSEKDKKWFSPSHSPQ